MKTKFAYCRTCEKDVDYKIINKEMLNEKGKIIKMAFTKCALCNAGVEVKIYPGKRRSKNNYGRQRPSANPNEDEGDK